MTAKDYSQELKLIKHVALAIEAEMVRRPHVPPYSVLAVAAIEAMRNYDDTTGSAFSPSDVGGSRE